MIDKTQERGQTDRQWSTKHKKGDKQTDNGRQNTTQKTKDRATLTILKSGPDMNKILSLNKKFHGCMFVFIY
jgi:hypothetical protein